jgi:hypothetical protein
MKKQIMLEFHENRTPTTKISNKLNKFFRHSHRKQFKVQTIIRDLNDALRGASTSIIIQLKRKKNY